MTRHNAKLRGVESPDEQRGASWVVTKPTTLWHPRLRSACRHHNVNRAVPPKPAHLIQGVFMLMLTCAGILVIAMSLRLLPYEDPTVSEEPNLLDALVTGFVCAVAALLFCFL